MRLYTYAKIFLKYSHNLLQSKFENELIFTWTINKKNQNYACRFDLLHEPTKSNICFFEKFRYSTWFQKWWRCSSKLFLFHQSSYILQKIKYIVYVRKFCNSHIHNYICHIVYARLRLLGGVFFCFVYILHLPSRPFHKTAWAIRLAWAHLPGRKIPKIFDTPAARPRQHQFSPKFLGWLWQGSSGRT